MLEVRIEQRAWLQRSDAPKRYNFLFWLLCGPGSLLAMISWQVRRKVLSCQKILFVLRVSEGFVKLMYMTCLDSREHHKHVPAIKYNLCKDLLLGERHP